MNIISDIILDTMGPVQPNINTLNILIKGLSLQLESVVNNPNEVELLVNKMKSLLEKFSNIDYDIVTYNTIIKIESGGSQNPTIDTLSKIAKALLKLWLALLIFFIFIIVKPK